MKNFGLVLFACLLFNACVDEPFVSEQEDVTIISRSGGQCTVASPGDCNVGFCTGVLSSSDYTVDFDISNCELCITFEINTPSSGGGNLCVEIGDGNHYSGPYGEPICIEFTQSQSVVATLYYSGSDGLCAEVNFNWAFIPCDPQEVSCNYEICLDCASAGIPWIDEVVTDPDLGLGGYCFGQPSLCPNGAGFEWTRLAKEINFALGMIDDPGQAYITFGGSCRGATLHIDNTFVEFESLEGSDLGGNFGDYTECEFIKTCN